jgi:DNA-binding beta-propeller fold protein YncE
MTTTSKTKSSKASGTATLARLFVLELSGNRVMSLNPDGSDEKVLVSDCRLPDGIVVDTAAGHIYWTNMGVPSQNDGSIERADIDGRNRTTIVPSGATFTPKQLHLEKASGKLYWCDREGMRVMRCNLDGTRLETLVQTDGGDPRPGPDQTKWCVGITIDPKRGHFYWTQKGGDNAGVGRILRANLEMPKGQTAINRTDIEVLFENLPEPIDLELDVENRVLYWTDRGDPPRGNTVNRASIDGAVAHDRVPEILVTHLMEGIGIALDLRGDRMFMTDLAGSLYTARLNGSEMRALRIAQGNLTGVAFAEIPQQEKKRVEQQTS